MSTLIAHRVLYPAKNRMVSVAAYRGTPHVELGDVSMIVPKFRVPVSSGELTRSVMISGRRYVSVCTLERWAQVFDRQMMPEKSNALLDLVEWAREALEKNAGAA